MKEILHQLEREIEKRNIEDDEVSDIISSIPVLINRRIISGYASVAMVDRENQKISIPALREAVKRFMADDRYRVISIFHSDAVIGRVLPKWTDPNSGKIHKTEVDDVGWKVVVELRDDIELANKVWEEIIKGNLRSFSVAGTSKEKHSDSNHGSTFTEIDELDLLEVTVCLAKNEKVWTKKGLKQIQDITINDYVLTHTGKWKKVIETMCREVNEKIIKITTEDGYLLATKEHPVRALTYGGTHKGSHYDWVPLKNLKVNGLISYHKHKINCEYCNTPVFEGSHQTSGNSKYCSKECQYKVPGNRKGQTIASGNLGTISQASKVRGITKKENPNLTGGIKTETGRLKQILGCQTPEFKVKHSNIQKNLWKDINYSNSQREKINKVLKSPEFREKSSIRFNKLWQDEKFIEKVQKSWSISPNKLEIEMTEFLEDNFPNEWKFTGNGDVWLGRKNPDFININGKKKIIELDGEFWHKDEKKKLDRIEYFKDYGYETLIITDKEFINNKKECQERIKEFCGNKLSKIIAIEEIDYDGKVYNLAVEEDESYTTEFAVVHNCSIPVNPMSMFSVLWEGKEKISI